MIVTRPITTPAGKLILGSLDDRLCLCDWTEQQSVGCENQVADAPANEPQALNTRRICRCLGTTACAGNSPVIDLAEQQLREYFAGERRVFSVPLLTAGTDFQRTVWDYLLTIPYGHTVSYKEEAQAIGRPKAVRAVARANAVNAISIFIPCHRVIGANNSLTGYAGGIDAKHWLIERERVVGRIWRRVLLILLVLLQLPITAHGQSRFTRETPLEQLTGLPAKQTKRLYWLANDTINTHVSYAKKLDKSGHIDKAFERYRRAYNAWQEVFYQAPIMDAASQTAIYDEMPEALAFLIRHERQPSIRKAYYEDLFTLLQTQIANLDHLDAVQPNRQPSENSRKIRLACMAYYYGIWTYRGTDRRIDLEQAYSRFTDGFRTQMEARRNDPESVESADDYLRNDGSRLIPPYAIEQFIRLSEMLYQSDHERFRQSFLQDYIDCSELCESVLETAESLPKMSKKRLAWFQENYERVIGVCDNLLTMSGAADSASIIRLFDPQVDDNRDNVAFLKRVMNLLEVADLNSTDTYFKAAEYAYAKQPTYSRAIITATRLADTGDTRRAIARYDEALGMAKTAKQRSKIAMLVSKSLISIGLPDKCLAYLDIAEQDESMEHEAQYLRAKALMLTQAWDKAIAVCDKSQQPDNRYAGLCMKLKDNAVRMKAETERFLKQKADYEKARDKKREEDDFWNKGR